MLAAQFFKMTHIDDVVVVSEAEPTPAPELEPEADENPDTLVAE